MEAKPWVEKIFFKNGITVELNNDDIVVFVGPNNGGKSTFLRELNEFLRLTSAQQSRIIQKIDISKTGEFADLLVQIIASCSVSGSEPNLYFKGNGFEFNETNARNAWNSITKGLQVMLNFFTKSIPAVERLSMINSPSRIHQVKGTPEHPIHFLYKDENLEKEFSGYFRQAFGTDLIIHRNAPTNIPLYVGERPLLDKDEERIAVSYNEKIESLELLSNQGDGMKAFTGVLLQAFISHYNILFIDEPEAFLHPPQAKLLGTMLANKFDDKQLFLATHSEDFLKGILENNSGRIKVIRIRRDGNVNHVNILDNAKINDVWKDPILKHSNIMSGLFHKKVILCESDSDCRFYSSILESNLKENEVNPDILFTHCGGKQRLTVVVKALKALSVPISVIADFDVLNDEQPLKGIYEALGGNWDDIKGHWKIVKIGIDAKRPQLETGDLKKNISDVFSRVNDKIMPKIELENIKKSIKQASAWEHAKSVGKGFVPSGEASEAFDKLQARLVKAGLFVVEVGELEGFDKAIGGHGPKWVNDVLEKRDLKTDKELENARNFIELVKKHI